MEITPAGDSTLIVRICDDAEAVSDECATAVLRACSALRATTIRGVVELAPAYSTIAVFYDPIAMSEEVEDKADHLATEIRRVLGAAPLNAPNAATRAVEIPVCHDAEFASDLADVAAHAGLSRDEVIGLYGEGDYRVQCVGFTPGFPYLAGLPRQLATPRRATPRTHVPAGSVAIGGSQTGVYPCTSPGGWNIIGRTPLQLFSAARPEPALLRAGDRVRFVAITRAEFEQAAR